MKLSKKIILAATAVLASSSTMAQLTTFESGTTASASEVNANFTALLSRIEALETDVAALEAAAPTQTVAGRTYTLLNTRGFIEDQRTGSTNDTVLLLNSGAAEVDISFNLDDTVTVGDILEEEVDLYWDTTNGVPNSSVTNISSTIDQGPQVISYTQDGNVISIPAFGLELMASADGSMLVFRNFGHDTSEDDGDDRFVWEFGTFIEIPALP